MKYRRVVVVAVAAALALSACSSDKKPPSDPNGSDSGAVTVYTTAGLKDIATRLVNVYTAKHPSADITVNTNSTPAMLAASVATGAPQVLLSVNPGFLKTGTTVKGVPLGQNRAVIAVSTKNPHKVANVTAFAANSGLKTSMCGARTGYGNLTQWVLLRAKVKPIPRKVGVGCETKAMQQVAKDELDAVLLFRAGSFPPKGVKLLDIPANQNIILKISYQVVGKSAEGFGAFLASPGAQQMLTANGYLP